MAIGWAIVSTGRHPDGKVAPAIGATEGAELVAVYSRDRARAEDFASRHGSREAYTSLEALLNDSRVDVVFIASPNYLHAPYTVMAAQAGKHVLVEKPMAVTVDEAVDMVGTCKTSGVKLGVGYHVRHHPAHIEARRIVREGVLGTISQAQAQWGSGTRGVIELPTRTGLNEWWERSEMVGGASALMGSGVHAIDDLFFILGQKVVEVAAISDGQTDERPLENMFVVCLKFSDGAIGTVCCGRKIPDSRNDVTIYGTDGRIFLKDALSTALQGDLEVISEKLNTNVSYQHDPLALFKRQVEAFNGAIQRDEEPVASGIDGLRVVQVTVAAIESASKGRTVKLEPLSVER